MKDIIVGLCGRLLYWFSLIALMFALSPKAMADDEVGTSPSKKMEESNFVLNLNSVKLTEKQGVPISQQERYVLDATNWNGSSRSEELSRSAWDMSLGYTFLRSSYGNLSFEAGGMFGDPGAKAITLYNDMWVGAGGGQLIAVPTNITTTKRVSLRHYFLTGEVPVQDNLKVTASIGIEQKRTDVEARQHGTSCPTVACGVSTYVPPDMVWSSSTNETNRVYGIGIAVKMHERISLDVGLKGTALESKMAVLHIKVTDRTDLNVGLEGNETVSTTAGLRFRM